MQRYNRSTIVLDGDTTQILDAAPGMSIRDFNLRNHQSISWQALSSTTLPQSTRDPQLVTSADGDTFLIPPTGKGNTINLSGSCTRNATFIIGFSSDCDTRIPVGATDAHVYINNAIQSCVASGGLIVLREGTYTCSADIIIDVPNVTLQGMGASTIIRKSLPSGNGGLIRVIASNVVVRNLQCNHSDSTSTATGTMNACLNIECQNNTDIENILIENLILIHGNNRPMNLAVAPTGGTQRNVIISNCTVTGMSALPSRGGAVQINIAAESPRSGIHDVTIIGCTIVNGANIFPIEYTNAAGNFSNLILSSTRFKSPSSATENQSTVRVGCTLNGTRIADR